MLLVNDYTVVPLFMDTSSGAHQWIIEFEKEPDNFEYFVALLYESLKSQNSDYESKINDCSLKVPQVIKVLPNLFYNWLKFKNKLGGQNKVPRLCNDRKIAKIFCCSFKRNSTGFLIKF
ncbi:MAG: GH3 auxin-responsive promoter family protein [Sphingobacteriaceae bacterium]|nr:GH3 auxin-responsive promoter family protein [Sphingobacteriaceae bacterium]